MYNIKAFVEIHRLINNQQNTVAYIGELPPICRTYSRNITEYTSDAYRIISLTCKDINEEPLPATVEQYIYDITYHIDQYCITHARPIDVASMTSTIEIMMNGNIGNLSIGDIVIDDFTTMPGKITFTTTTSNVTLYYSHPVLTNDYDEYEIVVIPPIENINTFLLPYSQVTTALTQNTIASTLNRINSARGESPETVLTSIVIDFDPPESYNPSISTTWSLLIYGPKGNYIDTIKNAVINYILSHTDVEREYWENNVFPSLFKTTEFVLFPKWDTYATINLEDSRGLYSSLVNANDVTLQIQTLLPSVSPDHIRSSIEIFPTSYKFANIISVPGINNIDGHQSLQELFPDYLPVSTSSLDFARMTINTQNWVIFLEKLLIAAENIHSVIQDIEIFRITRDNSNFVVGVFNNVNYLVRLKDV